MFRRSCTLLGILLLGLTLGGCTKCGWIWDQPPARSCSGHIPQSSTDGSLLLHDGA